MNRLRGAAALAAVTMLLAGCGSSGDKDAGEHGETGSAAEHGEAADLTTCYADAKPAATPYPDGFPADYPLPPQTIAYGAEDRDDAGVVVSAVTTTPFKDVLAFFNGDVTKAGYKVTSGETEDHDAEANWSGNGFHGRWAIRESAHCPGETVVQVLSATGS